MAVANNAVLGGLGAITLGVVTVLATLDDAQSFICNNLQMMCPQVAAAPTIPVPDEATTAAQPVTVVAIQPAAAPAPAARAALPGEETAWTQARALSSSAGYTNFLERFPNGRYADRARELMDLANAQAAASVQRREYTHTPSSQGGGSANPAEVAQMCQQWVDQAHPANSTASFAGGMSGTGAAPDTSERERQSALRSCINSGGPRR
jgi:hypothetical protein